MSAALGLGFFCGAVTALTRPHAQQNKTYLGLSLALLLSELSAT